MSKDISTIWTDGQTEMIIGQNKEINTTIKYSGKKLDEIYPRQNNKRELPIDQSFYNWSVGVEELQTMYELNNDSTPDTVKNGKYTKSMGIVPIPVGFGFLKDEYTYYNVPSSMGGGGVSVQKNDFRNLHIVTEFNYDEICFCPNLVITKINKQTGSIGHESLYSYQDYKNKSYYNIEEDETYYYAVSQLSGYMYPFDKTNGIIGQDGFNTSFAPVISMYDTTNEDGESDTFVRGVRIYYKGLFYSSEIRIINNKYVNNQKGSAESPDRISITPEWLFYSEDKEYPERQNVPISNYVYLRNKEDIILKLLASMGYYFYLGKEFNVAHPEQIYMPIIRDNATTGEYVPLAVAPYVDSDNKNWHNSNDIAYINKGSGSDDSIDDMASNDEYSISGRVKYYLMTSPTLASMINDIEAITDDPNVMNGFVSCYQIPLQSDAMTIVGTETNIRINGHTLNTSANRVAAGKTITLANIPVPRRHGNAYDYLTKYFIYTPYTDVIPLNYKCAGGNITIQLHPCVENCTAVVTVKCNNMIIYKSTVAIGTTSTISVENNAEKQLSIVDSCAKYAGSALSTSVGVATGNIPAVAAGAIGLIASTTHAMTAFTQSYAHSYGVNAGNMLSLMPSGIYLIEYVVKPDKPDNFAKINGNLVNKSAAITNGMGFTKFDKPRISTSLTAPENAELISMLENGVIL